MPEPTNRRHGIRLAALLLVSASAFSVAGCTSGTPVPPLGLSLADVAESQPNTAQSRQTDMVGQTASSPSETDLATVEQGDGGGSEATAMRVAMNEVGNQPSPTSPAARLAPPSVASAAAPAPIRLADRKDARETAEPDARELAATAMAPVEPPAGIPQPIRLPQNDIPRAKGQGEVALALAAPPSPIRLERPVSASMQPLPQPVTSRPPTTQQVVGVGNPVLPGVDKDRLFEIERKDGRTDNSDIDLDEADQPIRLASLSGLARLAPNGLKTQHEGVDVKCLKPALVRVLNQVEKKFGRPVIVTSGFRSRQRNARARGAKRSLHMFCAAADIQVEGVSKWTLAEYLRSMDGRGGVGTYCHTKSVHIDVGPERDWNWRCKRRRRR
ncbi:YcbK family protein [Notoacmeibacter marinus]|nr:D-Ala-D-Ala carboxypeptidase family metallohydrolase [Notoacmeibacter marinus]